VTRKLLLFVVLLLGFSVFAAAQDGPIAEVFGGYSYVRCDPNEEDATCSLNGWNAAIEFNVHNNVGVVVDFDGAYGTIKDEDGADLTDIKIHSFLFGPRFKMQSGRVIPFIHALFGDVHLNIDDVEIGRSEDHFAMAFGGGLDISVSDRISIRPAQLEYVTFKRQSIFYDNFRYSAGIIINIGSR
jgi:hypothetical protein